MNKLEAIKRRRVMEESVTPQPPGVFLEWIESTGTQWIEVIKEEQLDIDTQMKTEVSFPAVNAGTLQAEGSYYGVYWGVVSSKFTLGGGVESVSRIEANKKYIVDFHRVGVNNTLNVNGEILNREYTPSSGSDIWLFELGNPYESSQYKFKHRKYSAEIKTPKSHLSLLPFLHQDGRVGMWDTIGHKFYPNMGEGEFIAGPVVDDDFWELEYIESTGTQYIDTEIKGEHNSMIDITFSNTSQSYANIMGARKAAYEEDLTLIMENGTLLTDFGGNSANRCKYGHSADKYNVILNQNGSHYVNGGKIFDLPNPPSEGFETYHSLLLFDVYGNYLQIPFIGKVYHYKHFLGDNLIQHLIPVQKKISGEVCMYDLVSKRFFYNKGTGEFIAGPIKNAGFILTGTLTNDTLFSEILQTETEVKVWIAERQTTLKTIKIDDSAIENTRKFKDCSHLFDGCHNLTDIDVVNLDVSEVTNMSFMFKECSKLLHLNIAGWDTSNVTDLTCVFYECKKLVSLDLSTWNTSKVSSVAGAFGECHSLKSLNVATWDTSKVTAMSYAFGFCESLESLDLSKWVATNVSDMSLMFDYCITLTTIDLSSMIIHESINLDEAFRDMRSITTAYGKDIESCALLNDSASKAENVNFIVKQSIFRTSDNEIFKTNDNKILRV